MSSSGRFRPKINCDADLQIDIFLRMPDLNHLLLFASAALIVLIIPGPSVLYITARSVAQGRAAGLASVAGTEAGALVHVAGAALGLSVILMKSALAFSIVKYLGAGYLIYLGLSTLLGKEPPPDERITEKESLTKVFTGGAIVSIFNPKTALFFLAFLPQFVDVSRGAVRWQLVLFGLLFVAMAFVTDGAYVFLSDLIAGRLRSSRKLRRVQKYTTGGVYLALGVAAAGGSHSTKN
jgi:threonine/homoserine/homoserine lactone efflux protein